MNIQTIEVGSHWVLDGDVFRYTDDQKRQLEKAWVTIHAMVGDALHGLPFTSVIEPVVAHNITVNTNLNSSNLCDGYDAAVWAFTCCLRSGTSPKWESFGTTTKYRVGCGLCDTKEQAVSARVQCGDVTPELLIELAEWLKEK